MIGIVALVAVIGIGFFALSNATKKAAAVPPPPSATGQGSSAALAIPIDQYLADSPVLQPQPKIGQIVSIFFFGRGYVPNIPMTVAVRGVAGATVTAQVTTDAIAAIQKQLGGAGIPVPPELQQAGWYVSFSAPKIWGLGGSA
jgi:hypothetical protein